MKPTASARSAAEEAFIAEPQACTVLRNDGRIITSAQPCSGHAGLNTVRWPRHGEMRISLKQSSAKKQQRISGDHFVSARQRADFEGDHSTGETAATFSFLGEHHLLQLKGGTYMRFLDGNFENERNGICLQLSNGICGVRGCCICLPTENKEKKLRCVWFL